jgi:hypothetical protein
VDYKNWRIVLLCELAGGPVDGADCPTGHSATDPAFTNVLGDISNNQARLPSTPPAPASANPLFDQATFDALGKSINTEIPNLTVQSDEDQVNQKLKDLQAGEAAMLSKLAVLSNTLTNVQKDFVTYYQNILLATDALPAIHTAENERPFSIVGIIYDPRYRKPGDTKPFPYAWFLGRQVAYSVNAINNIATAQASIIAASSKVALSTVSVLYANPRFETSAGAIVSFVHNRTFANETITNAPASGSPYVDGDIVITQTKTDPEIVPIVAAHWRVGKEYLMPDHRRGAAYGTMWVGLNPYSNVPEFGAGPTFSWRSLMFSFLYNRAHQTSLVAGQSQGQILCGPAPLTGTAPPACTTTPPPPVTQTTGLNAFAIGLTIRIPTSFAAGTGGISR